MHRTFIGIKLVIFFIQFCILFSGCNSIEDRHQPIVEVRYQDGRAMLYRHGEPYFIKGAGGREHLDKIAEYGGNSIRTWSIHDAKRILDEAHSLGLTVTLGLDIGRAAWGKDFKYWKFWEVNKKIEELVPIIEEFKDHPALLMWGVGNEVHFAGGNRILISYTINKIAKIIKKIDKEHPTMTAIFSGPNVDKYGLYRFLLKDIDVLGLNSFGNVSNTVEGVNSKFGWQKAYIFSEWSSIGHWEVTHNKWGAPKELKSDERSISLWNNWEEINKDKTFLLGTYAFYWGNKYEVTHTWWSFFLQNGLETESVKTLQYIWSGKKAENYPPKIDRIILNIEAIDYNFYLNANDEYAVEVLASDPDGDPLTFIWELRPEEARFYETSLYHYNMRYLLKNENAQKLIFNAPKDEGPYRIFVFVKDNKGNVATHNIPFYVLNR